MAKPFTIFISYSHKDVAIAEELYNRLIDAEADVRFDKKEGLGESFIKFMNEGLKVSNVLLLLWSKNSSESYYVEKELEASLNKEYKKRIIPCLIDSTKLPPLLVSTISIDFKNRIKGTEDLIKYLSLKEANIPKEKTMDAPFIPMNLIKSFQKGKCLIIVAPLPKNTNNCFWEEIKKINNNIVACDGDEKGYDWFNKAKRLKFSIFLNETLKSLLRTQNFPKSILFLGFDKHLLLMKRFYETIRNNYHSSNTKQNSKFLAVASNDNQEDFKSAIFDLRLIDCHIFSNFSDSFPLCIFLRMLRKISKKPEKLFIHSEYENWHLERDLVKALKNENVDVSYYRDWEASESLNLSVWVESKLESSDVLLVIPPKYPIPNEEYNLKSIMLLGVEYGCRVIQLHIGDLSYSIEQYFKNIVLKEPELYKRILSEHFGTSIEPIFAIQAFLRKYKIVLKEEVVIAPQTTSSHLLEKAKECNYYVPVDVLTDRVFISNASKFLVEQAYELADITNPIEYLKANLEYARLLRFQGLWNQAEKLLEYIESLETSGELEIPIENMLSFDVEIGALKFELGKTSIGINRIEDTKSRIKIPAIDLDFIKLYKLIGNLYREQGDWQKTKQHLDSAINLAEIHKSENIPIDNNVNKHVPQMIYIDAKREYASYLMQQNKYDAAEKELIELLDLATDKELGKDYIIVMDHIVGILKYSLGQLYVRNGKSRKALIILYESLSILEKYDNPIRISFVLDWIGRAISSHRPLLDLDVAQNYIKKAKIIREKTGHDYFVAYSDLAIGHLYLKNPNRSKAINSGTKTTNSTELIEKAKIFFNDALKTFKNLQKIRSEGIATLHLGECDAWLFRTNSEIDKKKEAQDNAKKLFLKARSIFEGMDPPYEEKIRNVNFEILNLHREELKSMNLENYVETLKGYKEDNKINEPLYLNEIGEYRFHSWLKKNVRSKEIMEKVLLKNKSFIDINKIIDIDIGDDAAVLDITHPNKNYEIVLTTDAAPGSICRSLEIKDGNYAAHFSVIHSVSDLLAMGATPIAVLLNMYLVREAKFAYAEEVIKVVASEAAKYGAILVGGDIKERKEQSIGCVGVGVVEKKKSITRSNARPGQIVAISLACHRDNEGNLDNKKGVRKIGQRWAADVLTHFEHRVEPDSPLKKLQEEYNKDNLKQSLLFLPSEEMIAGAATGKIQSAIDTSDGFMSCLEIIGRDSNVDFILEEQFILNIIDSDIDDIAKELNIHKAQFLFNAGHDWEIVMTIEENDFDEVQKAFRSKGGDLAPLGRAIEQSGNFQKEIGIFTKRQDSEGKLIREIRKVPIFTDEKFVQISYEKRVTEWEDVDLNYYLNNTEPIKIEIIKGKGEEGKFSYELLPENWHSEKKL